MKVNNRAETIKPKLIQAGRYKIIVGLNQMSKLVIAVAKSDISI